MDKQINSAKTIDQNDQAALTSAALKTRWKDSFNSIIYSTLVLLIFVIPALFCFSFIRTNTVGVPYMDDWSILQYFQSYQTGHLDLLAFTNIQDSESKMFVPFMLSIIIASLTKYCYLAFTSSIFVLIVLKCLLLVMIGWPLVAVRKNALLWLSPIALITFSTRSWDTLLWANGLPYPLCIVFLLTTVWLLNKSRFIDWRFGIALVTATAASYCIGNGLAVWLIGLLQILFQEFCHAHSSKEKRRHYRQWHKPIIWFAVASTVVTYYLAHLTRAHGTNYHGLLNVQEIKQAFPEIAQFALACLGNSMASDKYTAIAAGCIFLIVFTNTLLAIRQKTPEQRATTIAPIVIIIFVISTVSLITLGRFAGGIDAALQSRYCESTNLGISALYLLLLSLGTASTQWDSIRFGILLGLICVGTITGLQYGEIGSDQLRKSRIALLDAVHHHKFQSDEFIAKLADFPDPNSIHTCIDYLEQHHMGLFAALKSPEIKNLRRTDRSPCFILQTINSLPSATYPLQRHIIIDTKKQNSLEFSGWSIDFAYHRPSPYVFISIDGKLDIPTETGIAERELAHKFKRNSFLYSGFIGSCRSSLIAKGVHTVWLKVLSADCRTYFESGPQATIEVQ